MDSISFGSEFYLYLLDLTAECLERNRDITVNLQPSS